MVTVIRQRKDQIQSEIPVVFELRNREFELKNTFFLYIKPKPNKAIQY